MTREAHPLLVPALLIGTFMGFLDLFIVTVALPAMRSDLHTSVAAAQLVLAAYVLAYGVALVTGGRLGDRFGRRRLFVAGMMAFTVASLLCAVVPNAALLIAARALQGLSAAAMLPQVLATFQVALPQRRRAAAIGAYGAVIGLASVCGQVVGGLLVQADLFGLGWRMLFLINLPIGVAGTMLAMRVLPQTHAEEPPRLDSAGLASITVALVALLTGLTEGPDQHWPLWTVAITIVGLLAAVAAGYVERRVERDGRTALVPPRIVVTRPVRIGLLLVLAFYASNTGFFVVLTFFLQNGLHASPLVAGLAFAPIGIGFSAASLLGRSRTWMQTAAAMAIGTVVMVVGLGAALLIAVSQGGVWTLATALLICGSGQGIVAPPLIGIILKRVEPDDAGAASGVLLTATQVANALGIAILGGVWLAASGLGQRGAFAIGAGGAMLLAALAGVAALLLVAPSSPATTQRPSEPREAVEPSHAR